MPSIPHIHAHANISDSRMYKPPPWQEFYFFTNFPFHCNNFEIGQLIILTPRIGAPISITLNRFVKKRWQSTVLKGLMSSATVAGWDICTALLLALISFLFMLEVSLSRKDDAGRLHYHQLWEIRAANHLVAGDCESQTFGVLSSPYTGKSEVFGIAHLSKYGAKGWDRDGVSAL